MATMNISLPDQMKDWVEAQAKDGRYANSSDYVRDLIRRDQRRDAELAEMEALIQEGIDSGMSDKSIEDIWREALAEFEGEQAAAGE